VQRRPTTKEATMAKSKTQDQTQAETAAATIGETEPLQIKIRRIAAEAKIPVYATEGAACFDLHALTDSLMTVPAGGSADIATGLQFEIPPGYCMRIYSRSGHGFRNGVRLANCVGIIDSDYRGEVRVKLANDSTRSMHFFPGDRIAQAEIAPVLRVEFEEADALSETERGEAGFGSTGAA
jgi:dUTP pyrophosphatase